MNIKGQGHFFTIYFPGFVCFVLYKVKISGERLQDQWSSGLEILSQSLETHLSYHYNIKMGCFGTKNFCQMSYCSKKTLVEVREPALLGYRNNAKSRVSKIDKQYFNLISMEFRKLFGAKTIHFV